MVKENLMSVKSKLRAAEERRQEKRRRKAAMTAKYEAWKLAGINSKSKRSRNRVNASTRKHTHPDGFCGNPGCGHCFPKPQMPFVRAVKVPSYFKRHNIPFIQE
jgi:hypothetical protein